MKKLRKVEYYSHKDYDPEGGFLDDGRDYEQDLYQTAIGLFHCFGTDYRFINRTPFAYTYAIVEDEQSGNVICIPPKNLKKIIK